MNVQELAEDILQGIDYDIFKEDLEKREILSTIEDQINGFLVQEGLNNKVTTEAFTAIAFKSESCDNYMFTSNQTTVESVLGDLGDEWYISEMLYIESIDSNVSEVTVQAVSQFLSEKMEG